MYYQNENNCWESIKNTYINDFCDEKIFAKYKSVKRLMNKSTKKV